jgi:hypothetical protein
VSALGGGAVDASALAVGAGVLTVRGALGRWGLALDVGLESARTNTVAPVTASAASQWLSASFSVAFRPLEPLLLDVALGLRGWRTSAFATGVDAREERIALSWGGVASAGVAWRLTGPLFLHARAVVSARSQVLHFNVEPLGPVLSLNPWTFGLFGGALVRFE